MSDLSSLVTILTPVVLITQHIRQAYRKHVGEEAAQQQPVTITLEVNGLILKVEADSATDATDIATETRSAHTDTVVTIQQTNKSPTHSQS